MNNLFWLTILVVVESIQLLMAVIYANTFFPPTSSMQAIVLPEWAHALQPEREIQLYRVFILTAVVFEAAAVYTFRSKLSDINWGRQLRRFLAVESLVLVLLGHVIFKALVYHHPYLTQVFWPLMLIVSVAVKVFWRSLNRAAGLVIDFLHYPANAVALKMLLDTAMPVFILLLIFMPNQEAALAQMYMVEQFHHFNTLIMVPAFASSQGALLNVDVNSQYGVGMPIVLGFLARLMGGVTYAHVLLLVMLGCILYYWLAYAFLRAWLKSALLAAIAIVTGIKWQMFDSGMVPSAFIVPNGLPVRFFWDIIFFMLVWRHIRKGESLALLALAVVAGGAVVWVSDTGSYLIMAFYAYLVYLLAENYFLKGMSIPVSPWSSARYWIIPIGTAVALYWLAVGNAVFHPVFWNNMKEFFQFFVDGYETVPFYYALADHRYLDNLTAILIPAVYMLTFLTAAALIFLKKLDRENAMVLVICTYGLASYHYFLNRSTATSYYVQCLPYVYVLSYWLKTALVLVSPRRRADILLGLLAFCLFALLTTHTFLSYPGMLNFHRNPVTDPLARPQAKGLEHFFNHLFTRVPEALKLPYNSLGQADEGLLTEDDFSSDQELVDYYHKDFDFGQDAALIDRLTPQGSKAAVMSSFDIKLLMQADRKPFFYCFPLLVERPMRMRNFPSTHMHTIARLQRTLKQVQDEKPEYIFMEKIFLINQVTANFAWWSSDVIALINYVRAYYEPYAQGYYLVAMKRKKGV